MSDKPTQTFDDIVVGTSPLMLLQAISEFLKDVARIRGVALS